MSTELKFGANGVQVDSDGGITISTVQETVDAITLTANTGAGGIDINAGTSGVAVDTSGSISLDSTSAGSSNFTHTGAAAGHDLTLSCTAGSVNVSGGEAASDAVALTASAGAGGITLTAGTAGISFSTTGSTQLDGATFQAGSISGTTTLTTAQSGTWFQVSQTNPTYTITLPAPSAGLSYKFILITAAAFFLKSTIGSAEQLALTIR